MRPQPKCRLAPSKDDKSNKLIALGERCSLSRALQLGAEKELTSMQEDYDSLQQELERVQGEQEDLKREVDRWQQADKEKDAHLDEKDAQIQRLEGEKRQAEQEKQQKELESKQWQQEADYLRKKESGSTESEKLSQENANLRHEVDGYHEQLTQMQREKDGLLVRLLPLPSTVNWKGVHSALPCPRRSTSTNSPGCLRRSKAEMNK